MDKKLTNPDNPTVDKLERELPTFPQKTLTIYARSIEKYEFDKALKLLWQRIKNVDQYINEQQPWKLNGNKLASVISFAVGALRHLSIQLQPFLPETAEKIQKQF